MKEKPLKTKAGKHLPQFLTMRGFQEHIISWSDDTIRRRIHDEGLPAVRDGRGYVFDTQEVLDWFKRRLVRAG